MFVGQKPIRDCLAVEIEYAKSTGQRLDHILFTGPAGMGKSTLAKEVATALGAELKSYVADNTWNAAKVYRELMKLDTSGYGPGGIPGPRAKRFVVFMDEVHLLPSYEPFYTVLQDEEIYWNGAVNWLPIITFIGATTNPATLPKPFIDRIPSRFRVEPYTVEELVTLIQHRYQVPNDAARSIAKRSRQTARIALHYAEKFIKHKGLGFFAQFGIDDNGLTPLDRAYLSALRKYNRPLSLNSLAAITAEDKRSLEGIVEPWLKQLGLIIVTPQGRMLAEADTVNREGRGKSERNQVDVLDNFMEGAFSSL